jgi:hypothetical protein
MTFLVMVKYICYVSLGGMYKTVFNLMEYVLFFSFFFLSIHPMTIFL